MTLTRPTAGAGRARSARPAPPARSRLHVIALALVLVMVAAVTSPAPHARAAGASDPLTSSVIGAFEDLQEGWSTVSDGQAEGDLDLVSPGAKGESAGRLTTTFSGGGWVGLTRPIELDATKLSLQVRSTYVRQLAIRFLDSTGQTFQHLTNIPADGAWHELTFDDLDAKGEGSVHWGGAGDGVWHGPMSSFMLIVNDWQRVDGAPASTTLDVDDVTVTHPSTGPTGPVVTVGQGTLGSVFTPGESVRIPLTADAAVLTWSARDLDGRVVDGGQAAPQDGALVVRPDIAHEGWYELRARATSAEGEQGPELVSSFGIVPTPTATAQGTPLGAATHFGQTWDPAMIPLLERGGYGWNRDEVYWQDVEQTRGVYTWPRRTEAARTALEQQGTGQIVILSYANPLYDDGKAPQSPEAIAAFTRYAQAVVEHYGTKDVVYEVWNEWNIGLGAPTPDTSAAAYAKVLKATSTAIREEHPQAVIIGPSAAGTPTDWLSALFEQGGLDHVDAVSFHPYSYPGAPTGLAEVLESVRALTTKHTGAPVPMVISEHGWPTGTSGRSSTEPTQAAYLTQAQLTSMAHGVDTYVTYDLVDDGMSDLDTESRFGVLHHPSHPGGAYTPKPAYVANALLSRAISGATHVRTDDSGSIRSEVYRRADGSTMRGLWSTEPVTVTLPASGSVTVTRPTGERVRLVPDGLGRVTLSLDTAPLLLEGVTEAPRETSWVDLDLVGDPVVGDRVRLDWEIEAPKGRVTKASLHVEGVSASMKATTRTTRTTSLRMPAEEIVGERTYAGVLEVDRKPVGLLATSSTIDPAVTLTAGHALDDDGHEVLRVAVANASSTDRSLEQVSVSIGGTRTEHLSGVVVPAQGERTVDVPLTGLAAGTAVAYEVVAAFAGEQQAISTTGTLVPRGADASWFDVRQHTATVGPTVDLSSMGTVDLLADGRNTVPGPSSPGDLSGTLGWSWDGDNLYVAAEVTDDVHRQSAAGGEIWQGDSIQLAVSSGAPSEATKWHEIGAALTPSGPQAWRWMSTDGATGALDVPVSVTRDEATRTTTYVLALPWSRLSGLSADQSLLSLSLLVNENDGAGREGTLEWGGGISTEKSSAHFNAARLLP